MRKDSLKKKKRSWPTQEVLSLLQDIREFSERLRDIFHLHSIIIEIAHLLLLNTEHKERNVWKHFNLREAGGEKKKRTGEESWAMKWYELSDRWLQTNQGRWCVLCWQSWSWAGFFGIDCLHYMPDPAPELDLTEKHDGRPSLTWYGHCPLLLCFKSEFYIFFFGHSLSLSLHCKRYLGR